MWFRTSRASALSTQEMTMSASGREPIGPFRADRQRNGANHRPCGRGHPPKVCRRYLRLSQSQAVPVGVDQAIQVLFLNAVGIDDSDLLPSGARETLEHDRTDTSSPHDTDVRTSQPRLLLLSPAVQCPDQTLPAHIGRGARPVANLPL